MAIGSFAGVSLAARCAPSGGPGEVPRASSHAGPASAQLEPGTKGNSPDRFANHSRQPLVSNK